MAKKPVSNQPVNRFGGHAIDPKKPRISRRKAMAHYEARKAKALRYQAHGPVEPQGKPALPHPSKALPPIIKKLSSGKRLPRRKPALPGHPVTANHAPPSSATVARRYNAIARQYAQGLDIKDQFHLVLIQNATWLTMLQADARRVTLGNGKTDARVAVRLSNALTKAIAALDKARAEHKAKSAARPSAGDGASPSSASLGDHLAELARRKVLDAAE